MLKYIAKAGRALHRQCHLDLAGGKTVLVAGPGRSGSTWLGEIINAAGDHRAIFEPFLPERVRLWRSMRRRQYIRPGTDNPGLRRAMERVLSGRLRGHWVDQESTPGIYRRRLVKAIRANLMLRWVREQFPGLRIVLLLRHPGAVAVSRVKCNWGVGTGKGSQGALDQPDLMEDLLEPFREPLEQAEGPLQVHLLVTLVETYVPLAQLEPGDAHLVFYERLCQEPEGTVAGLFEYLGRTGEEAKAAVATRVPKPSARSRADSAVVTGKSLVDGWREGLSPGEVEFVDEMLTMFRLDRIYGPTGPPKDAPSAFGIVNHG